MGPRLEQRGDTLYMHSQSKLASSGGGKYQAQKQTYREGKEGKRGKKIPDPSSISMLPVASLKLELCVIKLGINLAGVSYRASNRPSCSKFIVFVFNM